MPMRALSQEPSSPRGFAHEPSSSGHAIPTRRATHRRDRRLAFALPAAALLLALAIWPLVQLGVMSVHDVTAATLNGDWAFTGLDNFSAVLHEPELTSVVLNTLAFVVAVTGIGMLG